MKINFHSFCNALMRRRFFWAGFVVLFFTLRPTIVEAQLSQQEVTQALLDAFESYGVLKNGQDAIPSWPIDNAGRQLARYLVTGSDVVTGSVAYWQKHFYDDSLPVLRSILARVPTDFVASNSVFFASLIDALDSHSDAMSDALDWTDDILIDLVDRSTTLHDDLSGLYSLLALVHDRVATSNQLADVLSILRNQHDAIDVDLRSDGIAYGVLQDILSALGGSGSGSSLSQGLSDLSHAVTNSQLRVAVENFGDLYDLANYLNSLLWYTSVFNFDDQNNDWKTAFESSSFVQSNLQSVAFLADDVRRSATTGAVVAASTSVEIQRQDVEDRTAVSNSFSSWITDQLESPPEMESYSPADEPSSSYDGTMQNNLLPSSTLAPDLTHDTVIRFAGAGSVAGIRHDPIDLSIFSIAGGELGSWVQRFDTMVRAGYYGLLAVASALLFWRYQTKISFVLRDAPRV